MPQVKIIQNESKTSISLVVDEIRDQYELENTQNILEAVATVVEELTESYSIRANSSDELALRILGVALAFEMSALANISSASIESKSAISVLLGEIEPQDTKFADIE